MTDDDDTYGLGLLIIFFAVVFILCKLRDIQDKRASILPVYHEHRTVAGSHQQAYVPAHNTVNAGSERSVACVAPAPRVNPAFSATWTRTSDLVEQNPWVPLPTPQATSRSQQTKSCGAVNGGPSTLAPLHQYAIAANRASTGAAISGPAPTHSTVLEPRDSSTRVRSLASPVAQRYGLPSVPSQVTSGPSQTKSYSTVDTCPCAEVMFHPSTVALFQSYGSTDTASPNVATVSPVPRVREIVSPPRKTSAGVDSIPAQVLPACPSSPVQPPPPDTVATFRTEHLHAHGTSAFDQYLRRYGTAGIDGASEIIDQCPRGLSLADGTTALDQHLRGVDMVDPKASGTKADVQRDGQVLQATYYSLENAEHLRARAKTELRKRKEMPKKVRKARKERDTFNARVMRQISEMHESEHNRLNQEAADVFFKLNNDGLPPSKVDLHKLTVDEAIKFARLKISSARENKLTSITFITGKGIHSENNEARIKPALQRWLKEQKLVTKIQQKNEGRLVVVLETEIEEVTTAPTVAPIVPPNVLITTQQSISVTA